MVLMQFALWSTKSLGLSSANRKQFDLSLECFRKQIESSSPALQTKRAPVAGHWNGYRTFRVSRLVQETNVCSSVYLQAEDGKPIVSFQPGQHLTLKLAIAGEPKPVVRCYSLSDRPAQDFYRITVKSTSATAPGPVGRVSNFINKSLTENDRIEIKAPSGHFVLDEESNDPIVLLAGGIGITPMMSMVNHLIATRSERMILLVYGAKNTADHTFKKTLQRLSRNNANLHIVNCYSQPGPDDVEGEDYLVKGFASVDLLKNVLPNNQCQFYLCGPPAFMESLHAGLMEWGVPDRRIFFEAFGPASVGRSRTTPSLPVSSDELGASVRFRKSNISVQWDSSHQSLLELADSSDAYIDSGCRAGSCGTCQTGLLKGKVTYPENHAIDCPPGMCLACIARPDGPIELDA